jgi:4'-phosphopantetheinyl transferase
MGLYFSSKTENGTVAVWKIEETIEDLQDLAQLQDFETKKLLQFNSESRKKQWLSIRVLLRKTIGQNIIIEYTDNGKPFLKDLNLDISISHSDNFACILLSSGGQCGIDIEKISEKLEKVKHKFLHDCEYSLLNNENINETLCKIWSAKEAIYKMDGKSRLIFSKNIKIITTSDKDSILKAIVLKDDNEEIIALKCQKIENFILTYTI